MSPTPRVAGFTLVELLVGTAVALILLTLAAPALREIVLSQRTRTAASDIYAALALARSEAIRRNSIVAISAVNNDWAQGWDVRAGGQLIASQPPFRNLDVSGPSPTTIAFRNDGRLATGSATAFNFAVTGNNAVVKRCVKISATGRPTIQADQNRNGDCADG